MSRLPEFFVRLSPIREVLQAVEGELSSLSAQVDIRNGRLALSTAQESLSLWEDDYALPHTGSDAARRGRIRTALAGAQTLTVDHLRQMAFRLTGCDRVVVEERFGDSRVVLRVLFDGEAEDLTELKQTLARCVPAHLRLDVTSQSPLRPIVYHGTTDPLSMARTRIYAVSLDNHALFAGGSGTDSTLSAAVDAYDVQGVHTLPAALPTVSSGGAGARVGERALFSGGYRASSTQASAASYDADLTMTTNSGWRVNRLQRLGAASTQNHAVFGGGENTSYKMVATVDAFDEDLAKSTPTAFAKARGYYSTATLAGHAFFGGGFDGSNYCSAVEVYSPDLVRITPAALSCPRSQMGAAATGSHVLFACGLDKNEAETAVVDAYTPELTRLAATPFPSRRSDPISGQLGRQAVFAGGLFNGWLSETVCYDDELTLSTLAPLSQRRRGYYGAAAGDFLFLAGGDPGGGARSAVTDVYTLAP